MTSHDSDCATSNEPAMPAGACDCSKSLADDIRAAINRRSRENVSNTPDFILAEYMLACLTAFETASLAREGWYGKSLTIGGYTGADGNTHPIINL